MLLTVVTQTTIYLGILSLFTAVPGLQTHPIYLHRVRLTWFKDLNIPETADMETLHARHILPLTLYRRQEKELLAKRSVLADDFSSRLAFKLLRDEPDARLDIHLHGTVGCSAAAYRPHSYRALCSAAPDRDSGLSRLWI